MRSVPRGPFQEMTGLRADISSVKTSLPGNIEDEDLIDGEPFKPQPVHVRTGMSFTLARLKFAEISHKQIWQANNNSHPPYSFM
jgi:hypothetical protein